MVGSVRISESGSLSVVSCPPILPRPPWVRFPYVLVVHCPLSVVSFPASLRLLTSAFCPSPPWVRFSFFAYDARAFTDKSGHFRTRNPPPSCLSFCILHSAFCLTQRWLRFFKFTRAC